MNWYKQALIKMNKALDWDATYRELLQELGREPTPGEIQKRMLIDSELPLSPEKERTPLLV